MTAVNVTRQEISLRLCPACLMDLCDTCFGGTCICACTDYFPRLAPEPPGRCAACGNLLTAPGHLVACDAPAAARARLLIAAAEKYGARP